MKNEIKHPSLACLLLMFANSSMLHAIESQSIDGGTGIGLIRTADIIEPGFSSWYMNLGVDSYESVTTPGTKAAQIKLNLGYAVTLGQSTELGFSIPHAYYTPGGVAESVSGTRDLRATLKYRFLKPSGVNSSAKSVTFFSSIIPGSGDLDVSSGDALYGVEYNVSYYFDRAAIHTNFGYKKDDVYVGLLNTPYVEANFVTAAVGLEFALSDMTTLSLQGLALADDETNDKNLLISSSFLYALSHDVSLTLGMALGVPDDRSNPRNSVFMGLSYSPSDEKKPRKESFLYSISSNPEQRSEARHDELIGKINKAEQRLESLERTLSEHADITLSLSEHLQQKAADKAAEPVTGQLIDNKLTNAQLSKADKRYHIQIIVPVVRPNYKNDLISFVKNTNYRITQKSTNKLIKKKTYIYYRSGLGKQAITLGHDLKGNQVILNKRLPKGVDFQIVAGSDLLK
ncbi:MAG: hypothetical protein OEY36_05600 [Gammaproteobacteria bacterium]|nr:hypothetical protein [Gammaproteobacteria bacterium]